MKSSLSENIFQQLKNRILLNQLRQGELIGEQELVEQFHVSRTPIRQALQKLSLLGLVEIKDGVGTFVSIIDHNEMSDAYQIRCAIEKIAIQTSIYKIDERELDELEKRFLKFKEQLDKGGYGTSFEDITYADWELHDLIVNNSDNKLLAQTVEKITLLLRRYQFAYISSYKRATLEHIELIEAIKEKKLEKVCEILDEHLRMRPL